MFAAVVILALVASAQAFAGSDPLTEVLTTAVQHSEQHLVQNYGLKGDGGVLCLMGFISDLETTYDEVSKEVKETVAAVQNGLVVFKGCSKSDDKLVCYCQAIRDTWEGSASLRQDLLDLAEKVIVLVEKILAKCFSSKSKSAAFRQAVFPRQPIRNLA